VAAFLGEIAAAPFPADAHPLLGPARRNPAVMAEHVRRAWLELLAAEVSARPVLLVLEDLHWGDAPSLQLVDAALASLRHRPFMVLALARPEVRERFPGLWAERDVQEMRLGGLTRRAATELARHALPDAEGALVERLVERADGNAFFLEELLRAVATGHGDALPEGLVAMVQARLDALPREDRRALRAASVFGEAFWRRGALALLGGAERATPAADQPDALDALVARELLVRHPESRFPAEEELAFRHALLRDGAYASLPEAERVRAHRLAAEWLEGAGEVDPLILAVHRERGGEPARASACYLRAAQRALAGSDPVGALAHAERALTLGPDDALRLEVLQVLMVASAASGRLAEEERWSAEILAAAPRASALWCVAACVRIMVLVQRADPEARSFGVAAVEEVDATAENAGGLLWLLSTVSRVLCLAGHLLLAAPYHDRAEAIATAFGASVDPGSLGLFYMSRSLIRLYADISMGEALRDVEQAVRCLGEARDPISEAFARYVMGTILFQLGAFERAEVALRCAIEGSAPGFLGSMGGRTVLAMALVGRGALEEAMDEATQAVADSQRAANRYLEVSARTSLAYVLLQRGEFATAEREARAALGLGSADEACRMEAPVVLATAVLLQGRVAEALSLARELSRPGAATVPLVCLMAREVEARALLAAGEREAARALLGALRAEILAIADGIEDEALRSTFLARGIWSAPLLRLAESEGAEGVAA